MTRPTRVQIDATALLHNLNFIKRRAPHSKIIAMVKANAYGCGLSSVAPVLEGQIYAFGVACIEEAMAIRDLGIRSDCVLFQGIFSPEELDAVAAHHFQCVIHQPHQLQWLLEKPLPNKIKVWVKVNTGMHRLGFSPQNVHEIISTLRACPWVDAEIGIMTHLACADEPDNPSNQNQLRVFKELDLPQGNLIKSISNSAAILALPETHADVVRPGIMLYGVSPFAHQTGQELGLMPVMRFVSAISAIHHYPAQVRIGYGGTWQTNRPSVIGVVAVGYGDGYPRHIAQNTPVWINGSQVPIVGRVSMDMLTVDLTHCPEVKIGDPVELWGQHIPVESIALSAGTIAYELLCQFSPRVRQE
ncbi:alanine racemase [Legionella jamestowniensis]|uniref:Alanine racemase n=1 Tax=Legionella jamestowniensis TaxID=455 RepID=A0A0W0UG90_9GAMM|nr:alanine racemase [Legionella jamestowniensis]KTD06840.1 alanine racemase [Legionella jamestowniensis]OCH97584.1 alanine racemase [Legionella jamestowniensis]SFL82430.1 alanine racemase [Legionella jamestowniensis DSM 19215]